MARRRMIDPNIWQSEDFAKLSSFSKLVFIGLFSNADDEGRGRAKPVYVKSMLFPYDDDIRVTDVEKSLSEIAANMSITFYNHDGSEYYSLDNWNKWQKVERPSKSVIPLFGDDSAIIRGTVGEQSCPREEKEVKEEEKEEKDARARRFAVFWSSYPRKTGKVKVEQKFNKLNPNEELFETMLNALEAHKASAQWQKENGQFIPNPETWLNQRRWEDETTTSTSPPPRRGSEYDGIIL